MPATEPPHMTDAEREPDRCAQPGLVRDHQEGSWRTLIQKFRDGEWRTECEYPGDWALQWQAVATDERRRVERYKDWMCEMQKRFYAIF